MLTTRGRVVSISKGSALVRLPAPAGCGHCGSKGACGGGKERHVRVSAEGLHAGDEVTLSTAEGTLSRGVLTAYLMPAVTLIAGTIAGHLTYGSDEAAVAGMGLGLVVGLLLMRLFGRHVPDTTCTPDSPSRQ